MAIVVSVILVIISSPTVGAEVLGDAIFSKQYTYKLILHRVEIFNPVTKGEDKFQREHPVT